MGVVKYHVKNRLRRHFWSIEKYVTFPRLVSAKRKYWIQFIQLAAKLNITIYLAKEIHKKKRKEKNNRT